MTYLVNILDVIYVALLRGVNHLARPLSKIVRAILSPLYLLHIHVSLLIPYIHNIAYIIGLTYI